MADGGDAPRHRFPERVYGVGDEPDPRFSLANERTFLAWIRTSLALLAGGVALVALDLPMHPGLRDTAAVVLLVAGALLPFQAWFGWVRIERAMRLGRPLPPPLVALPVAVVVAVVGVLVLIGFLAR
ncbi:YidH family protein [Agromyces sp. MMS24-K17]|uniref:YidH family protein n=1 Tax=Agromyces sp. MMS24-K17 TaxID=3372850 RepID=UPI003754E7FC